VIYLSLSITLSRYAIISPSSEGVAFERLNREVTVLNFSTLQLSLLLTFYSYRIASIGDRSEAFLAGNTPKITPIALDTPRANATDGKSI
jgi:hypothetical protein